jgi:N-acyl-L-homoserine lactone synthetase
VKFIAETANNLTPDVYTALARYRHKVFVETLGWDLPSKAGLELDQFDRLDTQYVVAREGERYVGIARLLPTRGPYLLSELFPQLLGDLPIPHADDIWELSRFAAVDFLSSSGASGQFSSPIAVGLLRTARACAARHGVRKLITVSPLGVERLLRKAGFSAQRVAPPQIIGGHPLFACWIDLDT